MSEKVKVSKEVAEAIEEAKRKGIGYQGKAKMVLLHVEGPNGWTGHYEPLNGLDLDTFIRALYIGYEVEQTPEEKVREIYERHNGGVKGSITWEWQEEIAQIVELLGHKIKGVNA